MNVRERVGWKVTGALLLLPLLACTETAPDVSGDSRATAPDPGLSITLTAARQGSIFSEANLVRVFAVGSVSPRFFLGDEAGISDGLPERTLRIGNIPVDGTSCINVGAIGLQDNEIVSGGSALAAVTAGEETSVTIRISRELTRARAVPNLGIPVDVAANESRIYLLSKVDDGTGNTSARLSIVQGETFTTNDILLPNGEALPNPARIAVTPGGANELHRVFVGTDDGLLVTLEVTRAPSDQTFVVRNVLDVGAPITTLAVSPDGGTLLAGERGLKALHVLTIRDREGLRPLRIFTPRSAAAVPLLAAFNPTGEWAGVVYESGRVSVIETGAESDGIFWEVATLEVSRASGIAVSRDGKYAYVTSGTANGGEISLLEIAPSDPEAPLRVVGKTTLAAFSPSLVRISPGGGTLYVLSPGTSQLLLLSAIPDADGTLRLLGTHTLRNSGGGLVTSARALTIPPDGKRVYVVAQTADGLLEIATIGGAVPNDACK